MIETHDLDHPEACGFVNVSSDSYPIRTVTIGKYYERNKILPYCKKVTLVTLLDFESTMLYTKIQAQSFLSSGDEDFEVTPCEIW